MEVHFSAMPCFIEKVRRFRFSPISPFAVRFSLFAVGFSLFAFRLSPFAWLVGSFCSLLNSTRIVQVVRFLEFHFYIFTTLKRRMSAISKLRHVATGRTLFMVGNFYQISGSYVFESN